MVGEDNGWMAFKESEAGLTEACVIAQRTHSDLSL